MHCNYIKYDQGVIIHQLFPFNTVTVIHLFGSHNPPLGKILMCNYTAVPDLHSKINMKQITLQVLNYHLPAARSLFTLSTFSATSGLDGAKHWAAKAKSRASLCLPSCKRRKRNKKTRIESFTTIDNNLQKLDRRIQLLQELSSLKGKKY